MKYKHSTLMPSNRSSPSRCTTRSSSISNVGLQVLPSGVQEFQDFLHENGGHSGGWEEYDHRIFLKCREKHKGRPSFIADVAERLCGQSVDTVSSHEQWYQAYLQKRHEQRMAIKEWKAVRKEVQESRDQSGVNQPKKSVRGSNDSEKVKAAIEAWKLKVQEERRIRDEKESEEAQRLLQETTERRKRHEAELRRNVEAYRVAKKTQEMREQALHEEEMRKKELLKLSSRIPLCHFTQQDAVKMQEKRERREQTIREALERQLRLEKLAKQVSVKVAKDPDRLTKATKAWMERISTAEGQEQVVRAPFRMPRRATPNWRKGVTS